jgi:hypothetical protein
MILVVKYLYLWSLLKYKENIGDFKMTDLEKVQDEFWKIYKEYCIECKKLEVPYTYKEGLDGFENLEVSANDLFGFEKNIRKNTLKLHNKSITL